MRFWRQSMAVAMAGLMFSCVTGSVLAERMTQIPAALQEYGDLVDKAQQYRHLLGEGEWTTIFQLDLEDENLVWKARFDGREVESQRADPPAQRDDSLRIYRAGDRTLLRLDVTDAGSGHIVLGPPVSGEFAVEFTGRIVNDGQLCDLSIITNNPGDGPCFLFGSNWNVRNILDAGPQDVGGGGMVLARRVQGTEPRLQQNVWYTVRMEVRDGQVRGLINGNEILASPMGDRYDLRAPRQAGIYTFKSTIEIERAIVQVVALNEEPKAREQAWAEAFGTMSEAELHGRLEALIRHLANPDESIRNTAEEMLRRIGILAVDPLRKAMETGLPEQRRRAQRVLAEMGRLNR